MIRLTRQLPTLPLDIPSVRLQSLFAAYGTKYPFLTFWQQTGGGQITACLCRFYGHFTVWAHPSADFAELREFLCVLAEGEVFCSQQTAEQLAFPVQTSCIGLKCGQNFAPPAKIEEIPLQKVYDLLLLGRDGPVNLPNFEDWYPDISHRLRHGCARVVATPKSVALAGFESTQGAIITGVAVDPGARGKGLGRQAVADLCGTLQQQNKLIFVYTTEAVAPFYTKMGFLPAGAYSIINIK